MTFLTKIISGGQTGADQGALRVALELRLQTGGWAPKGWRTELGPMPELESLYGMLEHSSSAYPRRTLTNAVASDGTLWFGNPTSPGGHVTMRSAQNARRPVYVFVWPKNPVTLDQFFLDWMIHNKITVLNCAGNRESTNPGIANAIGQYLTINITKLREISP